MDNRTAIVQHRYTAKKDKNQSMRGETMEISPWSSVDEGTIDMRREIVQSRGYNTGAHESLEREFR